MDDVVAVLGDDPLRQRRVVPPGVHGDVVPPLREARERGCAARAAVLERYGLERFLSDWDDVLEEVVR